MLGAGCNEAGVPFLHTRGSAGDYAGRPIAVWKTVLATDHRSFKVMSESYTSTPSGVLISKKELYSSPNCYIHRAIITQDIHNYVADSEALLECPTIPSCGGIAVHYVELQSLLSNS